MWSFNLDLEEWNPVQIQSATIPQPRSDFGYSRSDENIVLFGGKGEAGLLNDLYLFNLRSHEWTLINSESSIMPTPRKGVCISSDVEKGISLIFGGITAIGYTNELWKFDWSTKNTNYSLLTIQFPA
jgi:hypothetical protein